MNDTSSIMDPSFYSYEEHNYSDYPSDYTDPTVVPSVNPTVDPAHCTATCVLLATLNVIIMVLGITGNGLVIWIAGFKTKSRLKTVNTVWYLSLAVSDFLFCAFLPLSIVFNVKRDWIFGLFMCKFIAFNLFLNMFSSVFLLVIICVDRYIVVIFPVWAQNKRTIRRALVVVLLAWIMSALLSLPAAICRGITTEYKITGLEHVCHYKYTPEERIAVVVCRFIFGFVIPLLIIVICYFQIIQKLNSNRMARSNKPFMIMTALIVTFFICWLPYHIFNLLQLNLKYDSVVYIGQIFGITLASANSFMNPFLYALMGKDFKSKCYAFLSRIENTFEEEGQSTLRGTSITNLEDSKLLSTV